MADFVFEQPSDEEVEYEENDDEEEEQEEAEDNEDADNKPKKKTQSPWDFSSYSESVADEHNRRSTTSIDFKISKARQQLSEPIAKPVEEDSDPDDSEPHRQVKLFPFSLFFLNRSIFFCC